jgi:hypothetical protein
MGDNGLVAEVYSVVGANRDDRPFARERRQRLVSNYLHD